MRPSVYSATSRALYRVFICPSSSSGRLPSVLQSQPARPQARSIYVYATQPKPFSKSKTPFKDPEHPLDEAISSLNVHFVDSDEVFHRNTSLSKLLTTFDRATYRLRQVALDQEDNLPICKLITEQELWAERRQKEKPKKTVADTSKQVELNWAAERNDVEHRVKKLQEFLREGRKVEVLLAPKPQRKGRKATPEEIEGMLKTLRAAVAEVEGAAEWKAMDGVEGKQSILYFRPGENGRQTVKKGASVEEKADKLAKKEAEKEERRSKQEKRMQKVKKLKEQQGEQQKLIEQLNISE